MCIKVRNIVDFFLVLRGHIPRPQIYKKQKPSGSLKTKLFSFRFLYAMPRSIFLMVAAVGEGPFSSCLLLDFLIVWLRHWKIVKLIPQSKQSGRLTSQTSKKESERDNSNLDFSRTGTGPGPSIDHWQMVEAAIRRSTVPYHPLESRPRASQPLS